MINSNAPSVADIAAIGGGNGGFGNWGGEGWWVLIILFALFGGWGRNGMNGGANGCGCDGACATVGDVERGFNNQSTQQRFNALDGAFAQLGYAQQQQNYDTQLAVTNAGYQNQTAINGLSAQLQQCCCDTQRAIDGVNYNMAQNFCNLGNQVQASARDIIDSQNCNTRAILDQITAFRMEDKDTQIRDLQSQVQALNLAASQQNQNRYLIDTLRPCPVPAYQTCNPWGANGYGGFGYGGCCSCN